MAFAGAGLADEVDDLMAIDEVELGERQDAVAVERGLEREVEAGQRLDGGEAGHLQRRLDAAALADGELLGEQHLDRLDGADLAALDLLDEMIERLQRARHAQADQVAADALDRCVRSHLASHGAAPQRRGGGRRRRRTPGDAAATISPARAAAPRPAAGCGCWPAAAGCDARR